MTTSTRAANGEQGSGRSQSPGFARVQPPHSSTTSRVNYRSRSITIIDGDAGEVFGADAVGSGSDSDSTVCDGKTDVAWGPLVATLETIGQ